MTTNNTTAANNHPADLTGWDRVKADYLAAEAAVNAACERETTTEEVLAPFRHNAPEATISYAGEAWTNGVVSLAARQEIISLTAHNLKRNHLPEQVCASDEFRAFCERVEVWRNDPAHVAAREANSAADVATQEAMTAQRTAWGAMVAYPLTDSASIADKLDTATPYADDDPECCAALLRAISADLHRVAA